MGSGDYEGKGKQAVIESELMRRIQMAATVYGARLFRNNCGAYRVPGSRGRFIRYGVASPGGSDLIGWTEQGRFLAVEVKTDSPVSDAQYAFLSAVRSAGGIGIVAYSVDDLLTALK